MRYSMHSGRPERCCTARAGPGRRGDTQQCSHACAAGAPCHDGPRANAGSSGVAGRLGNGRLHKLTRASGRVHAGNCSSAAAAAALRCPSLRLLEPGRGASEVWQPGDSAACRRPLLLAAKGKHVAPGRTRFTALPLLRPGSAAGPDRKLAFSLAARRSAVIGWSGRMGGGQRRTALLRFDWPLPGQAGGGARPPSPHSDWLTGKGVRAPLCADWSDSDPPRAGSPPTASLSSWRGTCPSWRPAGRLRVHPHAPYPAPAWEGEGRLRRLCQELEADLGAGLIFEDDVARGPVTPDPSPGMSRTATSRMLQGISLSEDGERETHG
ncbi:uncharacterized protein LOC132245794 isoform X2 [Alligator mississippiensis]|uniref:uncharacterized protein LOC132245794 isoform X2 n=1 Tax=Alligator mississippiensis TaxID=8496 RepID=UPI002877E3DE|nr:uncharacterized protein LOC132245794 isoform X2 [Alligator mississippiensis]XP_059574695.1 uncharacterized protein LOC132245794 isoform X2 [Alligator mississippiensis]